MPIYCEQTSHHPPITNYFVKGDGFKMDGYLRSMLQLAGNQVEIIPYGKDSVFFSNTGAHIT